MLKYLVPGTLFFVIAENNILFKSIGFILLLVTVFYLILNLSAARFGAIPVIRSELVKATALLIPFIYAISVSVNCFNAQLSFFVLLLIKLFCVTVFMLLIERDILIRGIKVAVYAHIAIFVIHFIFLALGQNALFNSIVGIETQVSFNEVRFIPFRATGLFDEPSTFGMSIMALILLHYFLSSKSLQTTVMYFTFSVPVMVVTAFFNLKDKLEKSFIYKLLGLVGIFIVLGFVFFFALERENTVKESPIGLRLSHAYFLAESPNILSGSGFCSAYGKFPLSLERDKLRSYSMGNFKDAGQLIYSLDRIGLIGFVLMLISINYIIGLKRTIIFLLYFSVSKIIWISMPMIILIIGLIKVQKNDLNEGGVPTTDEN